MKACADGLVKWLVDNEYTSGPCTTEDTLSNLDHVKVNESPEASVVRAAFVWLWCKALPPLDGRREAARKQLSNLEPQPEMPDPAAFADLQFGTAERQLAAKVRKVVASIEGLDGAVRAMADRDSARTTFRDRQLLRIFGLWVRVGRRLQRALEPTGYSGIGESGAIPHTLDGWRASRAKLELDLHVAGLSDATIDDVLPMGGGVRQIALRRERSRAELLRESDYYITPGAPDDAVTSK